MCHLILTTKHHKYSIYVQQSHQETFFIQYLRPYSNVLKMQTNVNVSEM